MKSIFALLLALAACVPQQRQMTGPPSLGIVPPWFYSDEPPAARHHHARPAAEQPPQPAPAAAQQKPKPAVAAPIPEAATPQYQSPPPLSPEISKDLDTAEKQLKNIGRSLDKHPARPLTNDRQFRHDME